MFIQSLVIQPKALIVLLLTYSIVSECQQSYDTYFSEVSRINLSFTIKYDWMFTAEVDPTGEFVILTYSEDGNLDPSTFLASYGFYRSSDKYALCQDEIYRLSNYTKRDDPLDFKMQIAFDSRHGYEQQFYSFSDDNIKYFKIEKTGLILPFGTAVHGGFFININYFHQFGSCIFYIERAVPFSHDMSSCILDEDSSCQDLSTVTLHKTATVDPAPIWFDKVTNQVFVGFDNDSRYMLLGYSVGNNGTEISQNPKSWVSTHDKRPKLNTFLLSHDNTVIIAPGDCSETGKKIMSYSIKPPANGTLQEFPSGSVAYKSNKACVTKMIINDRGSRLYTVEASDDKYNELVAYRIDGGSLTQLTNMTVAPTYFIRLTPDGCHILAGSVSDAANLVLYKINDPDPDFKCGKLPDISICPTPILPPSPFSPSETLYPSTETTITSSATPTNTPNQIMGEEQVILIASGGALGAVVVVGAIALTIYVCYYKHRKGYEPLTGFGGDILPPD